MINTPRKNGYSFKYGTLFYVPFFSCHLGISETFIRLYIYAIDFLLISSIFSNLSLKIFFIINRVLEHTKKNKKMEIEKFIKSLARKAKLGGRYSTANTYLYTLHSFQKFAGKASLTFEEITPESIKEYEQYLILNGKRYNTISLYMRMLRSICNQASEQNIRSTPASCLRMFSSATSPLPSGPSHPPSFPACSKQISARTAGSILPATSSC